MAKGFGHGWGKDAAPFIAPNRTPVWLALRKESTKPFLRFRLTRSRASRAAMRIDAFARPSADR